jgi:hypothetical protein
MYVVTVILFLIPCLLIVVGWISRIRRRNLVEVPQWRIHCVESAFLAGIFGALIGMTANILWLYDGGDPHGMGSAPGFWQQLRVASLCTYPLTLVLAILGKGKGRFFVLGAVAATILADFLVPILQMD